MVLRAKCSFSAVMPRSELRTLRLAPNIPTLVLGMPAQVLRRRRVENNDFLVQSPLPHQTQHHTSQLLPDVCVEYVVLRICACSPAPMSPRTQRPAFKAANGNSSEASCSAAAVRQGKGGAAGGAGGRGRGGTPAAGASGRGRVAPPLLPRSLADAMARGPREGPRRPDGRN